MMFNETTRPAKILGVLCAALLTVGTAEAEIDMDAAGNRITMMAAVAGQSAVLGPACGLRNQDWADDLESAFAFLATKPDLKTATTEETALESSFANDQLDKVKSIIQGGFERDGKASTCADFKRAKSLGIADKMVKDWRAEKARATADGWSGAGGK